MIRKRRIASAVRKIQMWIAFTQMNVQVHRSIVSYQPLNQCHSEMSTIYWKKKQNRNYTNEQANAVQTWLVFCSSGCACMRICTLIAIFIGLTYLFICQFSYIFCIICHINYYIVCVCVLRTIQTTLMHKVMILLVVSFHHVCINIGRRLLKNIPQIDLLCIWPSIPLLHNRKNIYREKQIFFIWSKSIHVSCWCIIFARSHRIGGDTEWECTFLLYICVFAGIANKWFSKCWS